MGNKSSKKGKQNLVSPTLNNKLDLKSTNLMEIPENENAKNFTEVWLQDNSIKQLNSNCLWEKAETIYLSNNALSELPSQIIEKWKELKEINLNGNKEIKELPEEVSNWVNLTQIYLNFLSISTIPSKSVAEWKNLRILHINDTQLSELPPEVSFWTQLTMVSLNHNNLKVLPKEIKNWKKVQKLFINENQLTSLPEEIGEVIFWFLNLIFNFNFFFFFFFF